MNGTALWEQVWVYIYRKKTKIYAECDIDNLKIIYEYTLSNLT